MSINMEFHLDEFSFEYEVYFLKGPIFDVYDVPGFHMVYVKMTKSLHKKISRRRPQHEQFDFDGFIRVIFFLLVRKKKISFSS